MLHNNRCPKIKAKASASQQNAEESNSLISGVDGSVSKLTLPIIKVAAPSHTRDITNWVTFTVWERERNNNVLEFQSSPLLLPRSCSCLLICSFSRKWGWSRWPCHELLQGLVSSSRRNHQGTSPASLQATQEHRLLLAQKHLPRLLRWGIKSSFLHFLLSFFQQNNFCFLDYQSCDASLLLDSTRRVLSEKETDRSFGMRNFRYIETIKEALERECPGVVSCSDILVLSARDGIVSVS